MKKIIAAMDGLKFSGSTTNYAVHFANQSNAHLVGIFMDDLTDHSFNEYELVSKEGGMENTGRVRHEKKDEATREQTIIKFSKACREAGLNFTVRNDRGIALQELLHETIYADLLIIESKETLTHYEEGIPTRFIHELLSETQCPVLVVPNKYKPIDKVVLLYDGDPASVYAIKTFSYLLPELQILETEVVSVKEENQTLHVPDNRLMKEFMKRHFPGAKYTVIKGAPEIKIPEELGKQQQNLLVVAGAYQRGRVSRWFKRSMGDILMDELSAPLFIAHKK